jgi:Secretion system C-terminal sorting domain
MKRFFIFLITILAVKTAVAQTPTFAEHIAPIVYNNCTNCHRQGEVGPMAFTNYDQVKSWGRMIKYVTQIKYMPPWSPDPNYRHFVGERALSDKQIQQIADWVDGGMPRGNTALEPRTPIFPSGSQVGTPDLVLTMSDTYRIAGTGRDDYRNFVLPTNLTQNKIVRAVEFRPGNNKMVHHVRLAYETAGAARAKDIQSPDTLGYDGFGGFNVPVGGSFDTWTPGKNVLQFPENIGHTLPANADILLQVHYAPTSVATSDRSSVNLFFKNTPTLRPVKSFGMLHLHLQSGPQSFRIPADSIKKFYAKRTTTVDMSVMSIYPHAHLLCRNWEAYAVTPTGDTIRLIKIDDWNYKWQGDYTLPKLMKIPRGSTVHAYSTYDNTVNNPLNPNNPPQLVTLGESTLEEMFVFGFTYIDYQTGDENISLASNVNTATEGLPFERNSRLYPVYPNPMSRDFSVGFYLDRFTKVNLSIYDLSGRLVKTVLSETRSTGDHIVPIQLDKQFTSGTYILKLTGDNLSLTQKMVVIE